MLSLRPWEPDAVLRYLLALFTSIFSGVLLVGWLNSPSSPFAFDPGFLTVVVGAVTFQGMALALTHFFLREHGLDWSGGFGFRSGRLGRSLLLAATVGLAVLPIALSLAWISGKVMAKFDFEPVVQNTVQTLQTARSIELKILLGFLAVLAAPVAEELVFRGILYPAIKQQGFPRLALWGTSLLFAAIHGNARIFLSLTVLAVILTLLYETTDNLLAPIVAHSLFNAANLFWLILQTGGR